MTGASRRPLRQGAGPELCREREYRFQMDRDETADFCSDEELGYERSRTRFHPGAGLALDETYRLAQLPLVAPEHPKVIPAREGTPYRMGRHPAVTSLVLPVPGDVLRRSPAYLELERDLRSAPFAPKVAWHILEKRWEKLHATICGFTRGDALPSISEAKRRELRRIGRVRIDIRGLFSGNLNLGRLYFRVYPERRDGRNLIRHIQGMLGQRETDLYVVGCFNLMDDLTGDEAVALENIIERWWNRSILQLELDRLWLLAGKDDLVLDGGVLESLPLSG
jgi:hypothetical protein